MTILEKYHEAYHNYNIALEAVNRLTKRGKDVPAVLLAQFDAAYTAYQEALEQMRTAMAGRK